MMDSRLSDYQAECYRQIMRYLSAGEKHISVAMPTGFGKTFIALLVAKEFAEKSNVLFLCYNQALRQFALEKARIENVNIDAITRDALLFHPDKLTFDLRSKNLWIIDEAHDFADSKLSKCLKMADEDTIIISFLNPTQEVLNRYNYDSDNNIQSDNVTINTQTFIVLPTGSLADLRTAFHALPEERAKVIADIQHKIAERKASIQQNITRVQNEKIKRLEEELRRFEQETQLLRYMLSFFGITAAQVNSLIEIINSKRAEILDDLNSTDEAKCERALKEMQDYIADIGVDIVQKNPNQRTVKLVEENLIEVFSIATWIKMSEPARSYLVTAKITFESMTQLNDADSLDYSGVCLLVTKAVEVETYRRFFDRYKIFLHMNYPQIENWPAEMTYNKNGRIIENTEFTLGSVAYITGFAPRCSISKVFLRYAVQELYSGKDQNTIFYEVKKATEFAEKVRKDYRNPSAHINEVTKTSAQCCFNYVVEIQKQLRNMLEKMDF